MIIAFVLILSSVGLIIAVALYSNFLPYFSLLSDIKNYNIAYYGANTAIERSLSVLRYQEAGFQGSGGWNNVGNITLGPASDYKTGFDHIDSLQREIIGRPIDNILPFSGGGIIENSLLSGSNDYYALSYRMPLRLPLWIDSTQSADAYSGDMSRISFTGSNINVYFRLNPIIKNIFSGGVNHWELCNTIDNSGDGVLDDVIVDRGWKGKRFDQQFSILPRNIVLYNSGTNLFVVNTQYDESLRESDINTMVDNGNNSLLFSNSVNPLRSSSLRSNSLTGHLIIANSSIIAAIGESGFESLLLDPDNLDQELTLFLARLLETCNGDIYPFLEYKIDFDNTNGNILPLPYFIVRVQSKVGNYTVNIYSRYSIDKDDTLSSFTVVF